MLLDSAGNDSRDAGRLAPMCSNLRCVYYDVICSGMHQMAASIAADW